MGVRPTTRRLVAGLIALAVIASIVIGGEVVARQQLAARVSDLGNALPGVTVGLSPKPALLQLASGQIDVEIAASDAALSAYSACRTKRQVSVKATEGALIVTTQHQVRGVPLVVDIALVPRRDGNRWLLVADSVSAAGVSLPAQRALKLLTGGDGTDSRFAGRLLNGVPLPSDDRLKISAVRFVDGRALVQASTSTHRTGGAKDGGLVGLRACR